MYILKFAIKRLASRPGNSLLSLVLFSIGIGIISLIILSHHLMNENIRGNLAGIDLVVGAKGSPMQLILSSVLHADYPTGNINLHEAEQIASNPLVRKYIPIALGDSYQGYRIVGTTHDYPELYNAEIAVGHWHNEVLEATIGHNVARTAGLKPGDRFVGIHGFQSVGHVHDDFEYLVTGIMKPTTRVIDNLIITPVESVWKVHDDHHHHHDECDHDHDHQECDHGHDHGHHDGDHDHAHHHHSHDEGTDHHHHAPVHGGELIESIKERVEAGEDISREEMEIFRNYMNSQITIPPGQADREITAMLLFYRSPAANIQLPRMVNESTNLQAASPAIEINRLFTLLAFGVDALRILAWVIILISGLNLFVNLWNTLRQGMSEIALMRVLGAGRGGVFRVLMLQGLIISFSGWLIGILISRTIWLILPSFHFLPETLFQNLQPEELLLLGYSILIGFLASLIPAIMAYKADIHYTLTKSVNA
jgi:putative ABC transport system permease protein